MSFIKAKEYIIKYDLENRIMEFEVSSATVKEVANVLTAKKEKLPKLYHLLLK